MPAAGKRYHYIATAVSFRAALTVLVAAVLLAACDSATEPGVPTHIEAVTSANVTGVVASEVIPAPTVRVTDQYDSPVQGVEIFFWTTAENGISVNTSARTGADGTATAAAWRLTTKAGRQELWAEMAGLPLGSPFRVTFTATARAGAAARLTALNSSQPALPERLVPLRVLVQDKFHNVVSGARVTFEIEGGGGSLEHRTAMSDSSGVASVDWMVGSSADNSVTASIPGLEPVRFTATVIVGSLFYELQRPPGSTWAFPAAWIALGADGRFVTSVDSLVGSGVYTISGERIIFRYLGDFLKNLGETKDIWAYPYSFTEESGLLTSDSIVIRRCWSDECWESDWTYRRTSR